MITFAMVKVLPVAVAPSKHLVPEPFLNPFYQLINGIRLITGRLVRGVKTKFHLAHPSIRTQTLEMTTVLRNGIGWETCLRRVPVCRVR